MSLCILSLFLQPLITRIIHGPGIELYNHTGDPSTAPESFGAWGFCTGFFAREIGRNVHCFVVPVPAPVRFCLAACCLDTGRSFIHPCLQANSLSLSRALSLCARVCRDVRERESRVLARKRGTCQELVRRASPELANSSSRLVELRAANASIALCAPCAALIGCSLCLCQM